MTTTEITTRLNTAYSLLQDMVESDIRSATAEKDFDRPALPLYLDGIYDRLLRAVELERDVEYGLITEERLD